MQVWENFHSSTPTDYKGDEPESRLEIKNKSKFLIKTSHFTLSGHLYQNHRLRTPVTDITTWLDVVHFHKTRLLDTRSIFRTRSRTSNIEFFAKIITSFVFNYFRKELHLRKASSKRSFIKLYIWMGSEYTFGQGSDTIVLMEIMHTIHNSKFVNTANFNVL